jgi:cyclic AMP-dependent transcription factor ATF-4
MKLEMQLNDPNKKDANKEAATRYRLKKLSEKDQMFETRMLLEKENNEVKRRCELVQTEINYLKNILVQMLLTKGVIGDQLNV